MKPDFDKMTLDELRDWVAREVHMYDASRGVYVLPTAERGVVEAIYSNHPVPATLDAASAAMPEGWTWQRNDLYWFGFWPINPFGKPGVSTSDTGNEIRDRFCLACKCRWAEKEAQQ